MCFLRLKAECESVNPPLSPSCKVAYILFIKSHCDIWINRGGEHPKHHRTSISFHRLWRCSARVERWGGWSAQWSQWGGRRWGGCAGRSQSRCAVRLLAGGVLALEPRDWNVATSRGRSVKGARGQPVRQDRTFPDISLCFSELSPFTQNRNKTYITRILKHYWVFENLLSYCFPNTCNKKSLTTYFLLLWTFQFVIN